MIFIGIDPGLSGGVAMLSANKLETFKMPTMKQGRRNNVDVRALSYLIGHTLDVLFDSTQEDCFVVIESAQKFSAGTNALTSTWFGFGRILAMLELEQWAHEVIESPRTWQGQFWKRPKLPKGQKFNTKEASVNAAARLWPKHDFRPIGKSGRRVTTGVDGLTDAALLAEYARRLGRRKML